MNIDPKNLGRGKNACLVHRALWTNDEVGVLVRKRPSFLASTPLPLVDTSFPVQVCRMAFR